MHRENTITYGGSDVSLFQRDWSRVEEKLPYKRTYNLKPGESWYEAETTDKQGEHYVEFEGEPLPVGAVIARELEADGAKLAVFTECWGGCVLVDTNLTCISKDGELGELLDSLFEANGNRWAGLPDVIAIFPDGRVAMREAKLAGKDRLSQNQHDFAKAASQLLGDKLDLAVVEWG